MRTTTVCTDRAVQLNQNPIRAGSGAFQQQAVHRRMVGDPRSSHPNIPIPLSHSPTIHFPHSARSLRLGAEARLECGQGACRSQDSSGDTMNFQTIALRAARATKRVRQLPQPTLSTPSRQHHQTTEEAAALRTSRRNPCTSATISRRLAFLRLVERTYFATRSAFGCVTESI